RTMAFTTGYNTGHFYRSIGIQDYFDLYDILRRTGGDTSDRAIYGFLSEGIPSENAGSPVFAYVDTIASHAPYSYAARPKETVPEADLIEDPIISEYVRRLIIDERDLEIHRALRSVRRRGRPPTGRPRFRRSPTTFHPRPARALRSCERGSRP